MHVHIIHTQHFIIFLFSIYNSILFNYYSLMLQSFDLFIIRCIYFSFFNIVKILYAFGDKCSKVILKINYFLTRNL